MPKVLGVDDSATMRTILEMTFAGESGVEVSTVDSGDAAIAWVTQNGADVVLADASMQGVDGYEIAAALRGNAATANTAVIVLASQHTPFDAERGRSSGVDDHVLKPFETQALIDKVKDVIQRPRAAASVTSAARVAPPAPPAPPRPAPARPAPAAPVVPSPASARAPARATVAFGAPPGARPPTAPPGAAQRVVAPPPASAAPRKPTLELADEPARPAPAPAAAAPARPAPVAAATASNGEMASKLSGMGLSPEQVEGVLALSREVIERVVWEVVPDLAETIIREEIRRLTAD